MWCGGGCRCQLRSWGIRERVTSAVVAGEKRLLRTHMTSTISCKITDSIAVIELSRSERGNALSVEMHYEVQRTLADLDSNEDVRVVLITGRGRQFCVGGDMAEVESVGAVGGIDREVPDPLATYGAGIHKPVVAAINLDTNEATNSRDPARRAPVSAREGVIELKIVPATATSPPMENGQAHAAVAITRLCAGRPVARRQERARLEERAKPDCRPNLNYCVPR